MMTRPSFVSIFVPSAMLMGLPCWSIIRPVPSGCRYSVDPSFSCIFSASGSSASAGVINPTAPQTANVQPIFLKFILTSPQQTPKAVHSMISVSCGPGTATLALVTTADHLSQMPTVMSAFSKTRHDQLLAPNCLGRNKRPNHQSQYSDLSLSPA